MNPFYSSLEVVWKQPSMVFINNQRLEEIARKISKQKLEIPNWRAPVYYPQDDQNFVQFVGIANSINFAFKDFETKRKFKIKDWRPKFKQTEWRGAFGMVACLLRAHQGGISVLDAYFLKDIDLKTMKYIFYPSIGYPLPMLEQRTRIFNQIGSILLEKYNGSFYNLLQSADFKAFGPQGIVTQLITNFSSFNDGACYQNQYLQFHKRAQLLVMIYHGRALDSKQKLPLIKDINDLGAITDYQIPRALEHLGILEYSSRLKQTIDNQQIIPAGSIAEVEIRAMTVLAIKRLLEKINRLRVENINICHLDFKLWDLTKTVNMSSPHHLTPTIFY